MCVRQQSVCTGELGWGGRGERRGRRRGEREGVGLGWVGWGGVGWGGVVVVVVTTTWVRTTKKQNSSLHDHLEEEKNLEILCVYCLSLYFLVRPIATFW